MNRLTFFAVLTMLIGAILVAKGLFTPLVNVPLIGAVRYVDRTIAGRELAWAIIALIAAGTFFMGFQERGNRLAWLFVGTGVGLTLASLLAVYREIMDKLQELGGDDVKTLLEKTQVQSGTFLIGIGIVLFLGGAIATLFERKQERW